MTSEQQAICKAIDQRNADQAAVCAAQVHYDACVMGIGAVWTGELATSLARFKRKVVLQQVHPSWVALDIPA